MLSREHAYRLSSVIIAGDWLMATLATFAGLQIRLWQRQGGFSHPAGGFAFNLDLVGWSLGGGALFVWVMILLRSYEPTDLYRATRWTSNVVKAALICAVSTWAYIGLFPKTEFSPRIGAVYCALAQVLLISFWRLTSFIYLSSPKVKEAACTRVVVVGWNHKAGHLRRSMKRDLAQLSEIVGCVPSPEGRFAVKPPLEVPVLGAFTTLKRTVLECRANSIILADVACPPRAIQQLIAFCQREMIGFQMIPEYFPALNSGLQVQTVSGVPLLGVSRLPLDRTLNRAIKRLVDVVGAVAGLLIGGPIIAAFATLVYLESPGPVIYPQVRTGRSGRTFVIYKIRSMRTNAEVGSGAVWCKKEDPRRLKIGTFMRRYNIDEIPQFWNVLKGDMSLVGPRPERPELIDKFKGEIPNYNARHEVRTGVTGWAQINGLRGDTDLRKRIEADLYYLENWTLWLDLYCMVATLFRFKNAH